MVKILLITFITAHFFAMAEDQTAESGEETPTNVNTTSYGERKKLPHMKGIMPENNFVNAPKPRLHKRPIVLSEKDPRLKEKLDLICQKLENRLDVQASSLEDMELTKKFLLGRKIAMLDKNNQWQFTRYQKSLNGKVLNFIVCQELTKDELILKAQQLLAANKYKYRPQTLSQMVKTRKHALAVYQLIQGYVDNGFKCTGKKDCQYDQALHNRKETDQWCVHLEIIAAIDIQYVPEIIQAMKSSSTIYFNSYISKNSD